ncbi:MAG: SURF1 family protein [Anaerolineales bacterium]
MFVLRLFNRRWVFLTVLVIVAALVMARLGIWQLDRLAQRRAFNAQVLSQITQPPLPLTPAELNQDLNTLVFRTVILRGELDNAHTMVIGNQVYENQMGVNLLTPFKIEGSAAVILVNRGWIAFEDWQRGDLSAYAVEGTVEVTAMLRATQTAAGLRECLDPLEGGSVVFPFQVWCVAVEGIAERLPYTLLPVYALQLPPEGTAQNAPPYAVRPQIEISEGNHLSYAVQWFSFATILLFGYPFFVRREERAKAQASERMNE